jgi:syntaxin 5
MTNLVMAQSESISRIEDDVEDCLQNVTEAHDSMQKFAEITKGNRGVIMKVFALLIFFILLFLVWT